MVLRIFREKLPCRNYLSCRFAGLNVNDATVQAVLIFQDQDDVTNMSLTTPTLARCQ